MDKADGSFFVGDVSQNTLRMEDNKEIWGRMPMFPIYNFNSTPLYKEGKKWTL